MGISLKQYLEYEARLRDKRDRKCNVIQEQQEDSQEQGNRSDVSDNRSKKESMDGFGNKPVRVSITWHISDKRRRDAWGMAETVADCIVAAFRRLSNADDTRKSKR